VLKKLSSISGGGVRGNTAVPAEARGFKSPATAQGEIMQKDWQAVQERELGDLENRVKQFKETLRGLLHQAEFHADEYRDELIFSYEQRDITPGITARFDGMVSDIKKALNDLNDKEPE
jgi:hypothetical protein